MADIVRIIQEKMFGCPLYIHKTKKACFVRLMGCPCAPIHLDAPICLDAPCMFDANMFGCPSCLDGSLYLLMPPCMFGHPVQMVFGCPLYTDNTKKACLVSLGVSICPHTFGYPLYINNTKHALSD